MAYEIWRKAQVNHPKLAAQVESMPNVVYSTKTGDETAVVVHSQTAPGFDDFALVPRRGRPQRISPQEALQLSECTPATPPIGRLAGHFEMVAQAIRGLLKSPPPEHFDGKTRWGDRQMLETAIPTPARITAQALFLAHRTLEPEDCSAVLRAASGRWLREL